MCFTFFFLESSVNPDGDKGFDKLTGLVVQEELVVETSQVFFESPVQMDKDFHVHGLKYVVVSGIMAKLPMSY
jgi:hypothetical protein